MLAQFVSVPHCLRTSQHFPNTCYKPDISEVLHSYLEAADETTKGNRLEVKRKEILLLDLFLFFLSLRMQLPLIPKVSGHVTFELGGLDTWIG